MTTVPLRSHLRLDALAANVEAVRALAGPGRRLIASIKANAYGHGAVAIARALAELGVDELATGSLQEVAALRAAGVDLRVMLLATRLPDDPRALRDLGVTPTVCSEADAARLASPGEPMPVYVKVDAGFGRLGLPLADAPTAMEAIAATPGVATRGVYTHLPFSDPERAVWAKGRLAAFAAFIDAQRARGRHLEVTQAGASCCLLAGLDDGCNAVCVGHLLYGISPFAGAAPAAFRDRFRPVFGRLETTLVHVGRHGQGADAAIAGAYRLERGRTLGVLPVGLAHGLGRPLAGRPAWCVVRGRRVPVVAVSLEHTTIDLDGCGDAAPGDTVRLIDVEGPVTIGLGDMAGWLDCSPLETLMRLSGRHATEEDA